MLDGRGGTIRMDKTQYNRSSQFRHGILTRGAIDCVIRNLTIERCAGDGIEVSPDFVVDVNDVDGDGDRTDVEPVVPTRNLLIDNVTCAANNRQGLSVTSVEGLRITNSRFTDTEGTEPESGIDFEPFRTYHVMRDIVVTDCVFSGNHGNGIQYGGVDIDATTPPCDILIERATVFGNGQNPDRFRAGIDVNNFFRNSATSSSRGTFTVRNSVVRDERASGINVRQYADGLDVLFDDVLVDNVANFPQNAFAGPVLVQPRSYDPDTDAEPCFGNVEFRNVRVIDDMQFFEDEVRRQVTISQLRTDQAGPLNVTGDICVETPFPFTAYRAPEPCGNVTLGVTACSAPVPLELLSFMGKCVKGAHELTWTIADATELTGFRLESSITGEDWTAAAIVETADAYARAAFAKTVGGDADRYYRLVSAFRDGTEEASAAAFVAACPNQEGSRGRAGVFPNPTDGTVSFAAEAQPREWLLADALGRVVTRVTIPAGATSLDLGHLAPGVYHITNATRAGSPERLIVR